MSELLKDPDNFAEGPLYISVDKATNQMLDYRNVRDKKDRDRFIKRALTNDIPTILPTLSRLQRSGDSMNIIQTLKQKLSAGSVLIQPGDPQLHRVSRIDPRLLLSTVKNANEIEIAYYPHQEGGNAILFRDACTRDDMQWTAVCPLVREEL